MYSSFHSPRSKTNQNKITSSPIFGNQTQKEYVKSTDYKFDTISSDSNYSSTDYQSQLRLAQSSSVSSLAQSDNQIHLFKAYSEKGLSYDYNNSVLTSNSCVNTTNAWSLTQRTESLMEKMEKFESKLEESKKLIDNLRKERNDLMIKAERIDEILSSEASPKNRRLDLRVQSANSSPGRFSKTTKMNLISTDSPRSAQLPGQRAIKKKLSAFSPSNSQSSLKSNQSLKKSESSFGRFNKSPKKVSFV